MAEAACGEESSPYPEDPSKGNFLPAAHRGRRTFDNLSYQQLLERAVQQPDSHGAHDERSGKRKNAERNEIYTHPAR